MKYFVLASDGQRYGPADVAVLNNWIQEGRLYPSSMLAPEAGGEPVLASTVVGLLWPSASAPGQPMQGVPSPSQSTYEQHVQPQMPMGGPFQSPQQPYAQYPRGINAGFGQPLPEEVRKRFNWGAFFFSWIWGLNHKQPILLVGLVCGCIPYLGIIAVLGIQIWAGINGNKWAWDSGRFGSLTEMEECQLIWAKWALGLFIFQVLAIILLVGVSLASGGFRTSP